MEEEIKLVIADTQEGEKHEFYIYLSQQVGKGGFGSVYKAVELCNKSTELAVKVVNYNGNLVKKAKIQKEVNILKKLPSHPNLVKVLPIKCFSENNFYMFMEYCEGGTLLDLIKEKGMMKEEEIFDIFYQVMMGYQALWEHGILHQDMKPENVLIRKNKFKITDFGFSILTEKYVQSLTREGTIHYMPLQKLTDAKYVASEKSDIYSIGVIMHYLITKRHPYVNEKKLSHQQFVVKLMYNPLETAPKFVNNYSFRFKTFLDIVYRMVAKKQSNRISCKQIFHYLKEEQYFTNFAHSQLEKSQIIQLNYKDYLITKETRAIVIPFQADEELQKSMIKQMKEKNMIQKEQEYQQLIVRIERFVFTHRMTVYFLDRLARRLYIEKAKNCFTVEKQHKYNKIILCFLLLQAKVTRHILKEIKFPNSFTQQELTVFKKNNSLSQLISKDDDYIQEAINENLKKTNQIKIQDQKALIDRSEQETFDQFGRHLADIIIEDFLRKKALTIRGKQDLITICYLIDGIDILKDFNTYFEKDNVELETYFRRIQTEDTLVLMEKVQHYFSIQNIEFGYEEEEEEEEEQKKMLE